MSAAGELRELSGIARPDVAVITKVAPRAPGVLRVAGRDRRRPRRRSWRGCAPGGVAVLNGDDARVRRIGEALARDASSGSAATAPATSRPRAGAGTGTACASTCAWAGEPVDVALPLPGPHFVANFLAAAAVAHASASPPRRSRRRPRASTPARHRGEVVRLGEGVTLLDDCYNSNPAALEAAVTALGLPRRGAPGGLPGRHARAGADGAGAAPRGGRDAGGQLDVLVAVGALAAGAAWRGARAGLPAAALLHFPDAASGGRGRAGAGRPGDAVLVKGSRGVRMEAVVDALRARFGARVEAREGLSALPPPLRAARRGLGAQRRPLHHVPHRGGQPDRALPGAGAGPLDDRAAAAAADRPVHPRGGAAGPPDQGGHAHHGRPADPDRHPGAHAALGRPRATATSGSWSSPRWPSGRSASPTTT